LVLKLKVSSMYLLAKQRRTALGRFLALQLTLVLLAWAEPLGAQPLGQNQHAISAAVQISSANRLLGNDDVEKFRPGRPMDEILKEVQWRGNFEMACRHEGRGISGVSYELFTDDPTGDGGEVVWAIFVDDKFQKFVEWPKPDMETVEKEGSRYSQFIKIKIGEFPRLVRADASKALNIPELAKQVAARPATPSHTDFGLAIAWLIAGHGNGKASEADYKRNAALRDQFNASRLKIGMTEPEIEAIFRAKPLQSGEVQAGRFEIYGSDESFDIVFSLHYSNVMVLFNEGKVIGIYSGESVLGGQGWYQKLQELFVDLTAPPPDVGVIGK
jgi:hypothetical protein